MEEYANEFLELKQRNVENEENISTDNKQDEKDAPDVCCKFNDDVQHPKGEYF